MTYPAIKTALVAAHKEASSFYTEADTARIVAAFLRALPEQSWGKRCEFDPRFSDGTVRHVSCGSLHKMAAAVERAARDGSDDR